MAIFTHSGAPSLSPLKVPLRDWRGIAVRSWKEAGDDNLGLISAGVGFYGFLAFIPLIGAGVLMFGIFADPAWIAEKMQAIARNLPPDAAALINAQLLTAVQSSGDRHGLGILIGLALAIFGARNGAGSIVTALNVAYDEDERRGFFKLNLLALIITVGGMVVGLAALLAIAALDLLRDLTILSGVVGVLVSALSYLLLLAIAAGGAATLYWLGPDREKASWTWVTPGSAFFAICWIALTFLFSLYATNFGKYDSTYGSLGAVVILLTWFYLSAYVLLLGAELNSEFEAYSKDHLAAESPASPLPAAAVMPAPAPAPVPAPLPATATPAVSPDDEKPGAVKSAVMIAGGLLVSRLGPSKSA